MFPIIVIGRGHGGTRAIARTLVESGIHMGNELNPSYDAMPPKFMYAAAKIAGSRVREREPNCWDFSYLLDEPPPAEYVRNVRRFLENVRQEGRWGWKLPETLLSFPWLVQLFPEASYIHWRRDPRDACNAPHITDNLNDWGVRSNAKTAEDRRVSSWVYQEEIVRATLNRGAPKRFVEVRFEDFVMAQDATLIRLESLLGFPLAKIPVDRASVGRGAAFRFPPEIARRFGY